MEGIELVCFKVIGAWGSKISFMEAVQRRGQDILKKRVAALKKGDKYHAEGHEAHWLLQQETSGEPVQLSSPLVHAEDQ